MARLVEALRLADETVVLDNTFRHPLVLLRVEAGLIAESHLDPAEPLHMRVAAAFSDAFGPGRLTHP